MCWLENESGSHLKLHKWLSPLPSQGRVEDRAQTLGDHVPLNIFFAVAGGRREGKTLDKACEHRVKQPWTKEGMTKGVRLDLT